MKTQRLAFCGASGTGKTTLAEWTSTTYGLPINPVGSRSVARAMGFNSAYETDAAGKRGEFQMRLAREKTEWEAVHTEFITDRTTFDNLAYSMLHNCQQNVDDALFELVRTGMSRYQYVVYCPVAVFINVGDDPERLTQTVYHQLYDATVWGLLQKFRPPGTRLIVMPFSQLEHRKDFLRQLMGSGKQSLGQPDGKP
jgi:predicted ATPase